MIRYELEDKIMASWSTVEDINLIVSKFMNEDMSEDEVSNFLIGLSSIHNARSQELFSVFEQLLASDEIK